MAKSRYDCAVIGRLASNRERGWPFGMTTPTDLLQRLTSLLGPAAVITDSSDLQPYAVDWRKLFPGKPACVVRPSSTEQVARIVQICREAGAAIVPAGRQYGAGRRCGAGRFRHTGRSVPQSHGGHPQCRSRRLDHRGGGRVHPEGGAGCGGNRRAPAADQPGSGGLGHHRRCCGGQCGRRERAALRHDPQPRARPRGGSARRHDGQWPAPPTQGQCGLRLEAALHRQRGHARDRHGGDPEASAAAEALRDGAALGRRSVGGPAASWNSPRTNWATRSRPSS